MKHLLKKGLHLNLKDLDADLLLHLFFIYNISFRLFVGGIQLLFLHT